MLSKYSWGDFWLFMLLVLVVYYVVIGALFYREQILALVSGKKLAPVPAGASPRPTRRAAPDNDLVDTTSAYTAPASSPAAVAEPGAEAESNLSGGQEQLVTGSLPDSLAATGSNGAPTETATAEAAGGTATNEAAQLDEEEAPELALDEVSDETKKMLLNVTASEKSTKEGNSSESLPTFVDNENDVTYEATPNLQGDPLEEYAVPVSSSLNLVSEQAAVFTADDVTSFLTELQDGVPESIPQKFADTTLCMAEEFSQHKEDAEAEIAGLFSGGGFSL